MMDRMICPVRPGVVCGAKLFPGSRSATVTWSVRAIMASIGLFGGSFDPVHLGHLLLAESCLEAVGLDAVWWVPAATPPHKVDRHRASAPHRVEMLHLATAGHPRFRVEECELRRGGVSYTVDTLRELTAREPDHQWYLLMGADTLADLPTWREPATICRLATPVVVTRAGEPPVDFSRLPGNVAPERIEACRRLVVTMPAIGLSSTDLRQRVAAGRSIRYRTPRAVEAYIETQGLYRS